MDMTRESRTESIEEIPHSADFPNGWTRQFHADIAVAVSHATPVLITAPMPCAQAIVRAIVSSHHEAETPEIVSYEVGSGELSEALAECRRVAARHGRAILWLKEVHRLETDAQRSLMGEMTEETVDREILQIVASSTDDLYQYVNAGAFDDRLFYRLNTVHIVVPLESR
jgi:replication-associated recombination protein RarA